LSERVPAGGPYRAAAGMHEPLSLEHIAEAKKLLSSYCPGRFCEPLLSSLRESSLLVAEARLLDLAWEKGYAGIDSEVVKALPRLVDLYARYISGMLLTHGEYVIVRVLRVFESRGSLLRKGDIARLPPGEALLLALLGMVEPLEEASVKMAAARSHGGQAGPGAVK